MCIFATSYQKQFMISESNLDLAGILASALCAIHCAIVPVMMTLGALGGGHWMHNHLVDYIFIFLGLIFAGFALLRSKEKHNSNSPLILAVVGFAILIMAQFDHGILHSILGVSGGLLIISAHMVNWRVSHRRIA